MNDVMVAVTDNPYVVLAIVIISGLTTWWQKRNKQTEHDAHQETPHPGATSQPNHPLNWEEELKRLLEDRPP
ncbi:MAG: hypothetical protein EBY09_20765, partial [Verrucomicrobia bacterium]|nr:hypothetical protein [Verrucomicrobiota bacterium]